MTLAKRSVSCTSTAKLRRQISFRDGSIRLSWRVSGGGFNGGLLAANPVGKTSRYTNLFVGYQNRHDVTGLAFANLQLYKPPRNLHFRGIQWATSFEPQFSIISILYSLPPLLLVRCSWATLTILNILPARASKSWVLATLSGRHHV